MEYKEQKDHALMSVVTFEELGKMNPLKAFAFSELLHSHAEPS